MRLTDCEKGCTGLMNDGYFIPLTLNELISGLKGIIQNSKDLTGEELVMDITYVDEEYDDRVPPGTIAFHLRQNTLNPDEPRYGTVVLVPGKTETFM